MRTRSASLTIGISGRPVKQRTSERVTSGGIRLRRQISLAKYLLVAHQTAERRELIDAALDLAAQDPDARFTLLVPATPAGDLLTWEEGETKEIARGRSESAAARLRSHGLNLVAVRVGDADPVLAVDDEFLAGNRYDAMVISTLPPGISRWIKMDVVSRLQRKRPQLRVIHVMSTEHDAEQGEAQSSKAKHLP